MWQLIDKNFVLIFFFIYSFISYIIGFGVGIMTTYIFYSVLNTMFIQMSRLLKSYPCCLQIKIVSPLYLFEAFFSHVIQIQ